MDKERYVVLGDDYVKFEGSFRDCVKWCQSIKWAHDAFKSLIILKIVADGKEV